MLVECRKVGAIEASDVGALPITPMSVIDGHGTDIGYRFTIEASDDGALPNVRLWRPVGKVVLSIPHRLHHLQKLWLHAWVITIKF